MCLMSHEAPRSPLKLLAQFPFILRALNCTPPHLEVRDSARLEVLHLDARKQPPLVPVGLLDRAVPDELDLWVVLGPLLHHLGGPQCVATVDHVHLGAVLGEEMGLLLNRGTGEGSRWGRIKHNIVMQRNANKVAL